MTRSHLITLFAAVIAILLSFHFIEASSGDNESAWQEQPQHPLQPEVRPDSLFFQVERDSVVTCTLTITNTEDEQIWFNIEVELPFENEDPFDLLLSWNASEAIGLDEQLDEDYRLNGICFADGNWYISGSNGDEANLFYVFSWDGELLHSLIQPTEDRYGFREIAYFNENLYSVQVDDEFLSVLDPADGELLEQINWDADALRSVRNIAIDPDNAQFFLSSITNDIYQFEMDNGGLVAINNFRPVDPRDDTAIRVYGLAWYRDDPDGFPLYILTDKDIDEDPDEPDITVFKANPELGGLGEVQLVFEPDFIDPLSRGRCGLCITNKWHPLVWVMATILDSPIGDQVAIFELGPSLDWITISPDADTLDPGEASEIIFEFDLTGFEPGHYGILLQFIVQPAGDTTTVPFEFEIVEELQDVVIDDGEISNDYLLLNNFPNPFNSSTTISFRLQSETHVSLKIFDINGRQIADLQNGSMVAGEHSVVWDGKEIPSGVYICRFETDHRVDKRKLTLIR